MRNIMQTKKKWFAIAWTALLLCVLCGSGFGQNPTASELLQRGIYLQETVGDLDGAIRVYRQIARMARESRAYAAQAEYRLGTCLLKKGQQAEAINTFQRLIKEYPEQPELVAKARLVVEQEPIVIWKVGSPYTGDTPSTIIPPDLARSAGKIGHKVEILAFPASGFAKTFQDAFEQNQEPDILVIDNYGIISGLSAKAGALGREEVFPGIGSNPKVSASLMKTAGSLSKLAGERGGWEFLFSTSRNYEAARSLVLRPPECSLRGRWLPVPKEFQTVAATIAAAYIEEKDSLLKPLEDTDRLNTDIAEPQSRTVSGTKECGYSGNDYLAFLPMVLRYESPNTLGWVNLLLILRKQQDQWRLLAASTDPISNTDFVSRIPELISSIPEARGPGKDPSPAKLLAPDDGESPEPVSGERFGHFTWQTSPSPDVVAEIVEFAYDNDSRLFIHFRRGETPAQSQISDGKLWYTRSPWRWRVWSIADSISFSEARWLKH